jgi:uncharacterized membrane protein YdjX (TVP38/TMEM64 family)
VTFRHARETARLGPSLLLALLVLARLGHWVGFWKALAAALAAGGLFYLFLRVAIRD